MKKLVIIQIFLEFITLSAMNNDHPEFNNFLNSCSLECPADEEESDVSHHPITVEDEDFQNFLEELAKVPHVEPVHTSQPETINPSVVRPRYYCNYGGCGKSFVSRALLTTHYLNHARPFKCTYEGCTSNGFRQHSDLRRHMLIHTEKSCVCDICGKSVSQEGHLKRHKKRYHPEE